VWDSIILASVACSEVTALAMDSGVIALAIFIGGGVMIKLVKG